MQHKPENTNLRSGPIIGGWSALSIKDGKIDKFNEFFNMDTETAINSIEKLIGIPGMEYIFTAHYGYSDDYTTAVQDWKK